METKFDKKTWITLGLWLLLILFTFVYPDRRPVEKAGFILFLTSLTLLLLISYLFLVKAGKQRQQQVLADISIFVVIFFFLWELFTTKLDILDSFVFPTPEKVLLTIQADWQEIGQHFFSSTRLLLTGYGLALILAVSIGLLAGSNKRIYETIKPLASVASPIPPIVYIPYAITLLPTFFISSVFVVFIGAFWPILLNTMNGVIQIEQRLIESARTLKLSPLTMFRKILLPGALPNIFTGATIGLVFSFILLTSAELICASSGLGYYIKYYTDFGDFSRVIVGIICVGVYVTLLMNMLQAMERYFLRWRHR